MDAMHWVLLAITAVSVAGVVWLLVQRGALAGRAATAEAEASAARERAERAEASLATAAESLKDAGRRAESALQEVARLNERVLALDAERTKDAAEAQRRLEAALEAERALHEQAMRAATDVAEEKLKAADSARKAIEEKLAAFDRKMETTFEALASGALKASSEEFLKLATERLGTVKSETTAEIDAGRKSIAELLSPVRETLAETDKKLGAIEKERGTAYATLMEQVRAMQQDSALLRGETGKLVKALREPQVRGRYGEVQLKRVAELAGMRAYCDFREQSHTVSDDGRAKRPDVVVSLPNGRELIVDAKANLKPYIDAMEAETPEAAEACLGRFADGVAEQAEKLAKKGYYSEYDGSPDFVVMFLPGDGFLDAALARRPDLLEFAAQRNVILASPASLIAMLRAVAVGFAEQKLSEEARAIGALARDLHDRICTALGYAESLGRALASAQGHWNKFVGSVDGRVLPQFRKIEEAGVKSDKAAPELDVITAPMRMLEAGGTPGEVNG